MPDADLLVVGAGPAGCAAAIRALRAGRSVRIVERFAGRSPSRPGETLHPGVEPLLEHLAGLGGALRAATPVRHLGATVAWGGPPRFEALGADADGPWRGFQVDRRVLDGLLLGAAMDLGATVDVGVVTRGLVRRGARIVGVETDRGPIHGRFVVDAGGGAHHFAKWLGVPVDRRSRALLATFGYVRGAHGADASPVMTADAVGWRWVAGVGAGRVAWVRVDVGGVPGGRSGPPAELAEFPAEGRSRREDVTWRIARTAAGPGWFLCGDAAAVLDPSSSHGVLRALMSGTLAAHAADRVLGGECGEDQAARGYDGWLRAWFDADVARLRESYDRARLETRVTVPSPS